MISRRQLAAFRRADDGSTAVEFAVVANAFLLLLMGTAYIAIMLWHEANLDWAVESGARLAALSTTATQSTISSAVNQYLASVGMGAATVQYTTATSGGVTVGTVSASKTEQFVVPLLSTFNITYSSSANVPQP